jgi:hypothetical protein
VASEITWQDRARYRQELLAEFEQAVDAELDKRRDRDRDTETLFE